MNYKLLLLEGSSFIPGDVFREYIWRGPFINATGWQRVTDPDTKRDEAKVFLPNPTNIIQIDDLNDAVKAEICIEMWGGHAGTSNRRVRINGNEWLSIPECENIGPGSPENYMQFRYPVISIPLAHLNEGENTFEFYSGKQIKYNYDWGQWGLYGVIFRIYYTPEKPHVSANIVLPEEGSSLENSINFSIKIEGDEEKVQKVEYIGLYEDFDYSGDGIYRDWQYTFRYGVMNHNLGTIKKAPFNIVWDTSWIPDQEMPISVMARVTDINNMTYITPLVDGLILKHNDRKVKIYKPHYIPENWMTRIKEEHMCIVYVEDELNKVLDAQIILVTWNGNHCTNISMNDNIIAPNDTVSMIGKDHDYSFDILDIETNIINQGANFLKTYSITNEHGIEVMWPGIVLKIRYDTK